MGSRLWPATISLAGTALAAGVATTAWGVQETTRFTLRRVLVPMLPAGATPVNLLHLSDLHLIPTQRRKIEWVRSLARLRPDVVISTGDLMADSAALPSVREALEELLEVPGAFVLGSNDYYAPRPKNPLRYFAADPKSQVPADRLELLPTSAMVDHFVDCGWLDLSNARGQIRLDGLTLDLVGVDDPHLNLDEMPAPQPLAENSVRIGVAHAPYRRVLDGMQQDGARLILAGHTHGGQIRFPGGNAIVTNCDLDRERSSGGLFGWPGPRPDRRGGQDSTWLHVSAGLGTSPYAPIRLFAPPEATLLTLVSED